MPVLKLDLIYEARGRGWEETYYRNFPTADFASAFAVATTLAQKRILMSAAPVVIKAYRVQDPLTPGRQGSVFYFNPVITPGASGGPTGAAGPSVSINSVWVHNATNASRTLQFRGIWDTAVQQFNQLNSDDFALWNSLFVSYRTYVLQEGFGWLTVNVIAANVPVSYSIDVNPIIPVFTFPAGTFAGPTFPYFTKVRFSRFNKARSVLNGELVVKVNSATQAEAAEPIATEAMVNGGRARIYGTPSFIAANLIGITKVGRRAPGAPKLETPSRSRARPRT